MVVELVLLGLEETADREKVGVEENTARQAKARGGYHKLLLRGGIKPVEAEKHRPIITGSQSLVLQNRREPNSRVRELNSKV
jgi:hypothetical protein